MTDAQDRWLHTDHGINIGQGSAWWWSRVVTLQAHRILTQFDGMQEIMDANLLLLALRQVIRGAEMARKHAKTERARVLLDLALRDFDTRIPGSKSARDVIEHFDEYTQGVGRLQQGRIKDANKRMPSDELAEDYSVGFSWETTPEGRRPILPVGPYSIDLIAAEDEAFRLLRFPPDLGQRVSTLRG